MSARGPRSRQSKLVTAVLTCLVLGALAVPPAAGAAVSVGHSGWFWGNPLPQGNTLNAVEFVGQRGYAAGVFGTVLRTDDAGASWSGIATGITSNLARIRVLTADTVVIGGGCTLRRSDDGGTSFRRLAFTASERRCSSGVRSFSFPTSDVGFLLLEDGTVLRTADGGATFSQRTAIPGTEASGSGSFVPGDIFFTGPDVGFAVTAAGKLFRTLDGAGAWTEVASTDKALTGLFFPNALIGYASGKQNTLLRSEDGGATWSAKPLGGAPASDLTSVRCADPTTCLIATEAGDRLLRTTDGGETAAAVTASTSKIFAAAFATATRAVAVGEAGATVVSDDAGVTFATVGGRLPGRFRSLHAQSGSTAYAIGADGQLARTTDGGQSWSGFSVPTPDDVRDAAFPSQSVGFAIDTGGSAFRTDTGGSSWRILNTGTSARPSALVALDQNRVLLVGPRGVRRSTNGGESFAAVRQRAIRRASLFEGEQAGGSVFAWGRRALFSSQNGGRSWRRLRVPRRVAIDELDFVNSRAGYLVGADGRVFATTNRGRRWRELPSLGTGAIDQLAFSDLRNGYVSDTGGHFENGVVLRTTDGGRSWRPQLVSAALFADLASPTRAAAFGLTEAGLFATASGGDAGRRSRLTLTPSRRRVRARARVRVTGRLSPPEGGELIRVSMRVGRSWRAQMVTAASNGRFTTTWRPARSTMFVAQWRGDDDRAGAGTRAVPVRVTRGRRGRR